MINFSEAHKRRRGFFEASIILYCFAEYDQLKIGLKEKKTRFKEANKRHNSSEFCCFSALCEERMVQGRRSSRFKSFVFVFVFFFFFFFLFEAILFVILFVLEANISIEIKNGRDITFGECPENEIFFE